MMQQVSEAEINAAKYAALGFINTVFIEKKKRGPDFIEFYYRIGQFADLVPAPNSRIVEGRAIDFYTPSFWHACCVIFHGWVASRYNSDKRPKIQVYRGQTNSWPLCPSLWRSESPNYGELHLKAIRKYLDPDNPANKDPSFEFFKWCFSLDGLTAFAQHHEFPTRLLDFTFHPLVALFFATRDSQMADFKNGLLNGHAVLYFTKFSNFQFLSKNTPLKIELGMLPPVHVPRLYQQNGFFIDGGLVTNKNYLSELELWCQRLYFPRSYPRIEEDVSSIFTEDLVMTCLANDTNAFTPPQLEDAERRWYITFQWYSDAIGELKNYVNQNRVTFDLDKAVNCMKESVNNLPFPWGNYSNFGTAKNRYALETVFHLARAALQVCNVARIYDINGDYLDEEVVLAYAKANKSLFEAILKAGEKMEIDDIHIHAEEIKSVKGVLREISGSLNDDEKNLVNGFPQAGYG